MPHNPLKRVIDILSAINYQGDKQVFAEELLGLIQKKTFADLISTLSEEEQEQLTKEIGNNEDKLSILNQYFDDDQRSQTFKKVSEEVLEEYLKEIIPTLSGEQLTSLKSVLLTSPVNT